MVASQISLNVYWILIKSMYLVLSRLDMGLKLGLCTNFQKKHSHGALKVFWIFKLHKRPNNGSEPDFVECVLDSN